MRPKKSLGQNFLKSKKAVGDIVRAANIKKGDVVLEIGPGKGVLTEALLNAGATVVAVEKDDQLFDFLNIKFADQIASGQIHLVNEDILDFATKDHSLLTNDWKLVANIPYYITGMIVRKFLSADDQPSLMVLLMQKEVARRIIARDGKESILSISIKVYGDPKYIDTVKAEYFSPKPKADSAILLIENISKNSFKEISEPKFFEMVKKGFSQKRKKVLNNLELPKEKQEEIVSKLNVDPNARAEDLALENWRQISNFL